MADHRVESVRGPTMLLSRFRYEAGHQCLLRLWNDRNAPHLATDDGKSALAIGDEAEVRRGARDRYPQGVAVRDGGMEGVAETRRLVEAEVPTIFGAAFEHEGLVAGVDVLERLPEGGWRLVRVKSAKSAKPRHLPGLAFDLWVSRGAGFDVRDAGLLVLDGKYLYDGVRLDPDRLFRYCSRLEKVEEFLPDVPRVISAMREVLASGTAPEIEPGAHCMKPYPCSYYGHCTRDLRFPAHGIGELPKLTAEQREALEARGIEEIEDIPPDFSLTDLQRTARESVRQRRPIVHGDLRRRLAEMEPPVRYLDFETWMPPIPRFAGTGPFEAIPFLFSVHTEGPGAALRHEDYLHEGSDDPRPALTRRLLEALGESGSICVYSSFEQTVLNSLAREQPRHAAAIEAVVARLYDLRPAIKETVYDSGFRGSFSLKRVFPSLCGGSGYDDLEISEGRAAAAIYGQIIASGDESERRRTFTELREYCKRDTLAMVELRRTLTELAPGERRAEAP